MVRQTQIHTSKTDFYITSKRKVFIEERPKMATFLESISMYYTIYFFTSQERDVAMKIIHKIAPFVSEKNCFCRDNCMFKWGYTIKDLRRIGMPLERVVMVDSSIGSALLQPMNCIGITSWDGGDNDHVLMDELYPLLVEIQQKDDIVLALRKRINTYSQNIYGYN